MYSGDELYGDEITSGRSYDYDSAREYDREAYAGEVLTAETEDRPEFAGQNPASPQAKGRRCGSIYGGARFERGGVVRCEERLGHDGPHFHSFAMRSWEE